MKRKNIVLLSIILLTIVLVGGGYYSIEKINFLADSVATPASIDLATLANATTNQTNVIPRIQLDYTKQEIETALYNYRKTSLRDINNLAAINKEIIAEINQKQFSLKSSDESADLGQVVVLDKNNQEINQNPQDPQTRSASVPSQNTITKIEDNFDFAVDIPQETRNNLLEMYPKIEAFYGKRSITDKIKVVSTDNCSYGRSCYSSGENALKFTPDGMLSKHTNTHELIHAFHGPYILRPLWEEGMTESATEILLQDFNQYPVIRGGLAMIENNKPEDDYSKTKTAENSDPYGAGSAVIYKIYLENSNFYKNFNAKYLEQVNAKQTITDSLLIKLVADVIPKVENEKTSDWFTHQYPFINPDEGEVSTNTFGGQIGAGDKEGSKIAYSISYNSTTKYIDFKAYDAQNRLVGECSQIKPDEQPPKNDALPDGRCKTYVSLKDYSGLVKVVSVQNGDQSDSRIRYADWNIDTKNDITATIAGHADYGIISDTKNSFSIKKPVINGKINISDERIKKSGKYKVGLFTSQRICKKYGFFTRCSNQTKTVATHYFNKADSPYFVFVSTESNRCNPKITSVKSLNRSISFQTSTTAYCGQTITLNGVPVQRIWDKNGQITISNLKKGKTYQIGVFASENSNLGTSDLAKVKTLSAADLQLVKAENMGDIAAGTFKRRYTFNQPYLPDSTKSISISLAARIYKKIPVAVKMVSPTSFDVIPSLPLYYNAGYEINDIDKITDKVGNPLYNYDFGNSYISFGLNQITKNQPEYGLTYIEKGPKNPEASVIVTNNFVSKEFADHIDPKYNNLVNYLNDIVVEKNGTIPINEVTRLAGIVKGCMVNITDSCVSFDLNGDSKVDLDDANLVGNYWKNGISYYDLMFKYQRIMVGKYNNDDSITSIKININQIKDNGFEITFPDELTSRTTYFVNIPYMVDSDSNLVYPSDAFFTAQ